VLPDIEKRLEAFVRMGHGIVVFPGGVGTAEEVLYLLGVLTDPANADQKYPVIFTGPASSADYFESLDQLITVTLGEDVRRFYRIIIDDAPGAAQWIGRKIRKVQGQRRTSGDAYYFNWLLKVPIESQMPFHVTHESVAALRLCRDMSRHELAANLRRAFSAIVTGNVKDHGIRMIREHGPFVLHGDREIIDVLEKVLGEFVAQGRMKLPGARYQSCFRLAANP
jgi:pyrimidine/purine-5'-nucleotide nucleosidase